MKWLRELFGCCLFFLLPGAIMFTIAMVLSILAWPFQARCEI